VNEVDSNEATSIPSDADWLGVARSAADSFGSLGAGEGVDPLRELLVFGLDESSYAIPVEWVREIVGMKELTSLPRSPDWLLGIAALRGEVIEIADLGLCLGLASVQPNRQSRIIVLHGDAGRVAGILVDSVSEVFRVPEKEVQLAQGLDVTYVVEICRRGDEFVSILDIERVLGVGDA
jgi:purine-binding chemotaxis protein CheW